MKFVRMLMVGLIAWQASPATSADASAPDTRAAYLRVIDRPRVALKPELAGMAPVEGLRKFHLWFHSDATERVPGYLLLPDAAKFRGPRPVLIALHGTGGTKEGGQVTELVLKAARADSSGSQSMAVSTASAPRQEVAPRSTTTPSRPPSRPAQRTLSTTTPPGT